MPLRFPPLQHLQWRTLRSRLRERMVDWHQYARYKRRCTTLALSFRCLSVLRRVMAYWKEGQVVLRAARLRREAAARHFRLNFLTAVFLSWQLMVGKRLIHRQYISRAASVRRRECLTEILHEWSTHANWKRVSQGNAYQRCCLMPSSAMR